MSDIIYNVDDIKTALNPVLHGYKVKRAMLFVSYVKGLANEKSDVDLLVDS